MSKNKKDPDAGISLRLYWGEFESDYDVKYLASSLGVNRRHVQGSLIASWLWCLQRRTSVLDRGIFDAVADLEGLYEALVDLFREKSSRPPRHPMAVVRPLDLMSVSGDGEIEFSHLEPYLQHIPRERRGGGRHRREISAGIRFRVLERDGFRCKYCGATSATRQLHVDHIVAVAAGGRNDMANLAASCADCNLGKAARSL